MTDIICPLCGKPNSPDLDECQYCQAPLVSGGFLPSSEEDNPALPLSDDKAGPGEQENEPGSISNLEQAVPDWLKETEAGFLEQTEPEPSEGAANHVSDQIESLLNPQTTSQETPESSIDDEWLASLLADAGAIETSRPEHPSGTSGAHEPGGEPQEISPTGAQPESVQPPELKQGPTPQTEKPDWLADLEASSKIKLEGGIFASEPGSTPPAPIEAPEEKEPEPAEQPDWLTKRGTEAPTKPSDAQEGSLAPAEIPGWLEVLRPAEEVSPTEPVEDVSGADIVTAGPLVGLRGVISAHPSAIRAQKPPTYSIKLRVSEEQQARVQLMEEMLAEEGKPKPLPTKPIITSRYIFRLIVALILLVPIIWMIVSNSQSASAPQPGSIPSVDDFSQRIQALPANASVLIAFDYEAGFSGEMNIAINNLLTQLMKKSAFLALVSTTSSGPALAETMVRATSSNLVGYQGIYKNYVDLGYIPGGTMGLLGLANSPRDILPYALDESNVWAAAPLNSISTVKDFTAVIVITNDPDTGRIWIEQVGSQLQEAGTPLLFITSAQAEPLIRPYYAATPAQVQGLISGLAGGVAYARTVGDYQPGGVWDAYSAGMTISILIILIGSIAGMVVKIIPLRKKKEGRKQLWRI